MVSENVPVVFMHIPKTAGISFVRALCDIWPGQIADMYGATDADPQPVKQFLKTPEAKNVRLFAGHISFGIHHWLPGGKCYYLSLMRDPVARILSLYRHSQMFRSRLLTVLDADHLRAKDLLSRILQPGAFPDFHLDFIDWITGDDLVESFLDCPSAELDNAMVRRFSGVGTQRKHCTSSCLDLAKSNIESQFAAVGLVEEYAKTLELFQAVLKLPPIALRHDNVSDKLKSQKKLPPPAAVTPEIRERICEMNQWDLALYEWVQQRFAKQMRQSLRRLHPIAANGDGTYRRCPLWKSVGTLGLSSIVVGSTHVSPVSAKKTSRQKSSTQPVGKKTKKVKKTKSVAGKK